MAEEYTFSSEELAADTPQFEPVEFTFTPEEMGAKQTKKSEPKVWEKTKAEDIPMWSSHGEGARRADLTKQSAAEFKSGKQLARKTLRLGSAGLGGALGAIATGAPTLGGLAAVGGIGGAAIGYGVGDVGGNAIFGNDPNAELEKMPPLYQKGLSQANPLQGLAREGMKPDTLARSAENLVKMPYDITKSIVDPLAQGDVKGAGAAATQAGIGLVEFPATATGLKDMYQKLIGEQPMDWQLREMQYMAENDPVGLAFGIKMASHAPKVTWAGIKAASNKVLEKTTDMQTARDLYRSSMKPTSREGKVKEVNDAIEHGLETGAVINRRGDGLEKVMNRVEAKEDIISGVLDPSTQRINIDALDKSLDPVRQKAFDDIENTQTIHNTIEEYINQLRNHPQFDAETGSIPVQSANAIKRNLYKNLRKGGAYDTGGVLGGRGKAAKGTAQVLMKSLEDAVEELGPLNKALGKDLNLQKYMGAAIRRLENTDIMGLRTRLAMMMGVAAPKYLIIPLAAAVFDNASFKSRLAIAIHKVHKGKLSAAQTNKIVADIKDRVVQKFSEEDFEPNPTVGAAEGFERNATPAPAPDAEYAARDIAPTGPEATLTPNVESQGTQPPPRGTYRPFGEPGAEAFEPNAPNLGERGKMERGNADNPADYEPSPQTGGGPTPKDRVQAQKLVDQLKEKQDGVSETDISNLWKQLREFNFSDAEIREHIRSALKLGGVAALTTLPFLDEEDRSRIAGVPLMAGIMMYHGTPKSHMAAIEKAGGLKPYGTEGVKKISSGNMDEQGLVWLSPKEAIADFYAKGGEAKMHGAKVEAGGIYESDVPDTLRLIDRHDKLTAEQVAKLNPMLPDYKPMHEGDSISAWSWRSNGRPIAEAIKTLGYDGMTYGPDQVAIVTDHLPAKLRRAVEEKMGAEQKQAATEDSPAPPQKKITDYDDTVKIGMGAAVPLAGAGALAAYAMGDEESRDKLKALGGAGLAMGSIVNGKGNNRNLSSKTPQFVAREVAAPRQITPEVAVNKQAQIKAQITKLVPRDIPVRMTSVRELAEIARTGKLRVGESYEGAPGISAQIIPSTKNPPIMSYGGNNYMSAAIVFPKQGVVGKGGQPNEVKINPDTPIERARFIVSGYKRMLTFNELRSLHDRGLLKE